MRDDILTHSPLMLHSDPSRVILRPFIPGPDPDGFKVEGYPRARRITERVLAMSEDELRTELARFTDELDDRHRDVDQILKQRFEESRGLICDPASITNEQAMLIGAYFSQEYAYEAAALFNPSMVPHPDQSGMAEGATRFVLSLRGVGEGHISSITFRTGLVAADGSVAIDKPSTDAVAPIIEIMPGGDKEFLQIRLSCSGSRDISETVIFPITSQQREGLEDTRLVRFVRDNGEVIYYGTYTATSGSAIRVEMLSTKDFTNFELTPLRGKSAGNKGLALFPRKLDGRYAALSREDGESLWLLTSEDLHVWDGGGVKAIPAVWPWEFMQIGNCGSPIELDEGWLVITHGIGAVRNYCLGVPARPERSIEAAGPAETAAAPPWPRSARRLCTQRALQLRGDAARTHAGAALCGGGQLHDICHRAGRRTARRDGTRIGGAAPNDESYDARSSPFWAFGGVLNFNAAVGSCVEPGQSMLSCHPDAAEFTSASGRRARAHLQLPHLIGPKATTSYLARLFATALILFGSPLRRGLARAATSAPPISSLRRS